MNARRLNLACTLSIALSVACAAAAPAPAAGGTIAVRHPLHPGDPRTASFVARSTADGRVTGQPQLGGRGLPDEPTTPIERSAALVVTEDGNDGSLLADRVTSLTARWGRPCGSFDTQSMLDRGIGFSLRLH